MESETDHSTTKSFTFTAATNVEIYQEPPTRLITAKQAFEYHCDSKEQLEDFSHKNHQKACFLYQRMPGLLLALHVAYDSHYPLHLSVSDFIIMIGQGLGQHIKQNSEKLRYHFVNHEGQEMIEIRRDHFVKGQQNDWSTVFEEFSGKIKEKVKTDIHDIIIDDTSVATPTTRIVSQVTLMKAMEGYFHYGAMTKCGIPQITLEGTPGDWETLQLKVNKLLEMNQDDCLGIGWWLEKLVPIVAKICDTGVRREVDVDFWSQIYKKHMMSGGLKFGGWITTFFPYLQKGRNTFQAEIKLSQIPTQVSQVPFIWEYYEEKIPMKFCAGFLGAEYDAQTNTIKPSHFWSVNYDDKKKSDQERVL